MLWFNGFDQVMNAEGETPRPDDGRTKQTRKRAVRLTEEGRALFEAALVERWKSEGSLRQLSRAEKARLLGVHSASTAQRILAGEGVDRRTLVLACRTLGLKWRTTLCKPATNGDVPESTPQRLAEDTATQELPQRRRRWGLVALFGLALGGLLLSAVGAIKWGAMQRMQLRQQTQIEEQFRIAFAQGEAHYESGRYSQARDFCEAAIACALHLDRVRMLANATALSARIDTAEGRYEHALEGFGQALILYKSSGTTHAANPILEMIGDLETRLGRYVDAEQHLLESLEGADRVGNPIGMAEALRNLGTVAHETGRYELADRRFAEALEYLEDTDGENPLARDIRARRALATAKLGRTEEARRELEGALQFWRRRDHPRWIATTYYQLAQLERFAGNLSAARAHLDAAEQGYYAVGDLGGVRRCVREREGLAAGLKPVRMGFTRTSMAVDAVWGTSLP